MSCQRRCVVSRQRSASAIVKSTHAMSMVGPRNCTWGESCGDPPPGSNQKLPNDQNSSLWRADVTCKASGEARVEFLERRGASLGLEPGFDLSGHTTA